MDFTLSRGSGGRCQSTYEAPLCKINNDINALILLCALLLQFTCLLLECTFTSCELGQSLVYNITTFLNVHFGGCRPLN